MFAAHAERLHFHGHDLLLAAHQLLELRLGELAYGIHLVGIYRQSAGHHQHAAVFHLNFAYAHRSSCPDASRRNALQAHRQITSLNGRAPENFIMAFFREGYLPCAFIQRHSHFDILRAASFFIHTINDIAIRERTRNPIGRNGQHIALQTRHRIAITCLPNLLDAFRAFFQRRAADIKQIIRFDAADQIVAFNHTIIC